MKLRKFCVYGNPTLDIIEVESGERYTAYGGGSYYSSLPLLEAGERVYVYAVYSPLLVKHPISSLIVKRQFSARTNVFVLKYKSGGRMIKVVDKAPPLYPWNTHDEQCYTIVNPVLGEIRVDSLKKLKCESPLIAVDIQGFLRKVVKDHIEVEPESEAFIAVSMADVVHLDIEELYSLVGCYNVNDSINRLSKYVKGIAVVTSRPDRVYIVTRYNYEEVHFENTIVVRDRTGSGDYYLSSFFYNYILHGDELEAAYRAHELTSRWLIQRNKVKR